MDPMQFIILLVIAGVCGAIGQAIVGYTIGGLLVSIGLGFIGALLGRSLAANLGLPEPLMVNISGANDFPVVWSIVGATLFVMLVALLRRDRVARLP